jgi:hypothetical protein
MKLWIYHVGLWWNLLYKKSNFRHLLSGESGPKTINGFTGEKNIWGARLYHSLA